MVRPSHKFPKSDIKQQQNDRKKLIIFCFSSPPNQSLTVIFTSDIFFYKLETHVWFIYYFSLFSHLYEQKFNYKFS